MEPFTPLNWKEIATWVETLRPHLVGQHIERIIVPARARFSGGFLKGEWLMRLQGRGQAEGCLVLSVRTRRPYFYWWAGKGPKASEAGTRSGFDLSMGKHLKGTRLTGIEALPRERIVRITFQGDREYQLVHSLIPALPELWLLARNDEGDIEMLARSRNHPLQTPSFPDGSKAPSDLPVRNGLVSDITTFQKAIESSLDEEAFTLRRTAALRTLADLAKTARKKELASSSQAETATTEVDYRKLGDLLKAVLYQNPSSVDRNGKRYWKVTDFETGEETEIEGSASLDARAQVDRYYSLERRKKTRLEEGTERAQRFSKQAERYVAEQTRLQAAPLGDWSALQATEEVAGIRHDLQAPSETRKQEKKGRSWLGRTFHSKDGLVIFVGKSKDENLELTFKIARGNDVWMHIRGRPGAHVVVPVTSGKSVSLETLLDAAQLCLFYSGGENWGKTEIDYTFKKYVKRIKDSTEASYTQNKTLLIAPERSRLDRLLSEQNS